MADNGSTRLPRYPFTRSTPADATSRDQQANDPLSELARLIGQQDPLADPVPPTVRRDLRDILSGRREPEAPAWSDPDFAERRDPVVPGRRTTDWAASPPPAETHYGYSSYNPQHYEEPGAELDNFDNSESGYRGEASDASVFELPHLDESQVPPPYEAPSDYGQGTADVPLYGDNGRLLQSQSQDEETYPPGYPAAPYQPEEAPPRSRKSLAAVIAVFCLAVAGTAGAYAYRMMFSGGTAGPPPLIRADSTPNKVPVAQSGDTSGKQIYDRFGGDKPQNEKVVSREEQPVDVRPAQARPSFPPPSGSSAPPQSGWPAPAGTNNAPAPTGGANAANEPRRIKTVPIRADQVASAPATAEPQAAPPVSSAPPPTQPTARTEPRPAATPRQATTSATSSSGPLSLSPQGSARTASATPTASGAYVVQLAAHKTQEEASAAFRSAQSRYPSILGSQRMLIRRKEVAGHGTFYGAQVGPFASRSEAVQLCESLKSAGGDCIVQRN